MAISLKSISRSAPKPPITVIHGNPGVGKSSFGAGAPGAVFIQTEDGLGGLQVDAFPLAGTWQDVLDALGVLYTERHSYQTVVVDSLSALELLIHARVAQDHQKANIDEIPYGRGHGFALGYWQQFMDGIAALRDHQGMLPVLIAHSEISRFDAPDVDSFERYVISLHKRAMALLYERADIIGFAAWRTHVVKQEVGFQKKVARGVGTGERLLHLIEKPAYIAKNRYNLPETVPLSWQSFSEALNAALPQPEPQPKPQPKQETK